MDGLNTRLKREIWKHLGDNPVPEELKSLLTAVSASYDNYEKEHALLSRIMDLSSEELFDANTELRKRNDELDRFVYSTSHDLRAPLTSILGLLQLIDLSDSKKEKELYLKQIKISTSQLDNFIQDIVSYTHNKKMDLVDEEIDPKEFINESIEKLDFMPNSSRINKEIKIRAEVPFFSDAQRLRNLLSNLISNSIKYYNSSLKNPFLKIDFIVNPERAIILVEDNGIGIKEIHQSKVFEMFYRASPTSKGSGIGLYIVKEIVEKLGGSISVESHFGKGSTFIISLPNKYQPPEKIPSKKTRQ